MKNVLRKIARPIKLLRSVNQLGFPAGHFYSPINSKAELKKRESEIWATPQRTIKGIDLNEEEQLELLSRFRDYYKDLPFDDKPKEGLRYYYDNGVYSYSDAIFLFCMIRHNNPKRIIEVGSGFSSSVMLDTNNLFYDNSIKCTFIEPYPDRLNKLLKANEQIDLIQKPVQEVDISLFEELEEGDILFIDSTHVSKTGSDVNFLLFEVLPVLKKGVKIHFHDIFYPFEYPKDWVLNKKRNWNEDYILRAYLTNSTKFKIIAFSSFLGQFHKDWIAEHMPLCLKNRGGNIWLEVIE